MWFLVFGPTRYAKAAENTIVRKEGICCRRACSRESEKPLPQRRWDRL